MAPPATSNLRSLLLVLAIALQCAFASASPTLVVGGDLPTTGTLELADLDAMADSATPQQTSLWKLLVNFGFGPKDNIEPRGDRQKRGGWKKKAIVATSSDGYQAYFSGVEICPEIGPTIATISWNDSGATLTVPTDKDESRRVDQLCRIDVIDLRQGAAPALAASEITEQMDTPRKRISK